MAHALGTGKGAARLNSDAGSDSDNFDFDEEGDFFGNTTFSTHSTRFNSRRQNRDKFQGNQPFPASGPESEEEIGDSPEAKRTFYRSKEDHLYGVFNYGPDYESRERTGAKKVSSAAISFVAGSSQIARNTPSSSSLTTSSVSSSENEDSHDGDNYIETNITEATSTTTSTTTSTSPTTSSAMPALGFNARLAAARQMNADSQRQQKRENSEDSSLMGRKQSSNWIRTNSNGGVKKSLTPVVPAASSGGYAFASAANSKNKKNQSVTAADQVPSWAAGSGRFDSSGGAGGSKALKMMAKMGWKPGAGGLGAHGEGMTQAVEVKQRPAGMGMGFGNFEEATAQQKELARETEKQERMARRVRGELVSSSDEDRPEDIEEAPRWQRSGRSQQRRRFVVDAGDARSATARPTEAINEKPFIPAPFVAKVYDLTGTSGSVSAGATVDNISSVLKAQKQQQAQARASEQFMPELQDFARSHRDSLSSKCTECEHELRLLKHDAELLQRGLATAEESLVGRQLQAEAVQNLIALLRKAVASLEDTEPWTLKEVAMLFAIVQNRKIYWDLLREHEFHQVSTSLALAARVGNSSSFGARLQSWNPLDNSAQGRLGMETLDGLADFRKQCYDPLLEHELPPTLADLAQNPFVEVLSRSIICKVRGVLTRRFDPLDMTATSLAVSLLLGIGTNPASEYEAIFAENKALWALVPQVLWSHLLDSVVAPKLAASIREWDVTSASNFGPHTWVFPWLQGGPVGVQMLSELRENGVLSDLASKLKLLISQRSWTAVDDDLFAACSPWLAPVADGRAILEDDRNRLLTAGILPRLAASLVGCSLAQGTKRAERQMRGLMRWLICVSASDVSASIESSGFWREWHGIVRALLSTGEDIGAIHAALEFCERWRALMAPLLAADGGGRAREHIYHALMVVDVAGEAYARSAHIADGLALLQLQPTVPPKFRVPPRSTTASAPNAQVRSSHTGHFDAASITFHELVEEICTSLGAGLMRTEARARESGRPIYRITQGELNGKDDYFLFMQDNVIFIRKHSSDPWSPVSLEELPRVIAPATRT